MPFAPNQVVVRRYVRAGRTTFAKPMRVVRDDPDGLLLWMPVGTEVAQLVDTDGKTLHERPLHEMEDPLLVRRNWRRWDILVLMPPGAAYSIWWFFAPADGAFGGWYANLETPFTRRPDGVETTDQVLDIVVGPDRTWEWKDEDEFAAAVGAPGYFDAEAAATIRAEGERLIDLAKAGAFPFDGTHTDFRPDPATAQLIGEIMPPLT
ncbi:DUF402 domain-containing protein [Actinoplanes sp. TRM 88003]|uniref:DUF402 domain-containing protein n=1 Tax=Paractinoplanes aksuensis TaxID=2939490 RepID=A0ABT1DKR1_9ACTN|nr:DUF402 domain-containing protein [Actinoplanes aksuensis]MCO8270356.1 DUF402 domain-containing protein [Actinoplanes aksuensis]